MEAAEIAAIRQWFTSLGLRVLSVSELTVTVELPAARPLLSQTEMLALLQKQWPDMRPGTE